MRNEQEANRAIELYADTVRRLCMIYLKNYADTEDVFQNVFIKYVLSPVSFKNTEHEKAWIIRVTVNECKDILKSAFRRKNVPLEEVKELTSETVSYTHLDVYKRQIYPHYRRKHTSRRRDFF